MKKIMFPFAAAICIFAAACSQSEPKTVYNSTRLTLPFDSQRFNKIVSYIEANGSIGKTRFDSGECVTDMIVGKNDTIKLHVLYEKGTSVPEYVFFHYKCYRHPYYLTNTNMNPWPWDSAVAVNTVAEVLAKI